MEANAEWELALIGMAGEVQPEEKSRQPLIATLGGLSLKQAYAACRRITAEHSRSFSLASALLPADKRRAVRALYAFCRTVDDIVDRAPQADAAGRLEGWREVIRTMIAPPGDAVALAWLDTLSRYRVPTRYAFQLIDGVARDLVPPHYPDFASLSAYCYGVASTVGLMSMYIVGFRSPRAVPYAVRLGVALQMTNILRDVGEDLRQRRLYLPLDELRQFGLDRAALERGEVTPAWRAFMRFQIARTRDLYARSWEGLRLLEPQGRLAIAAASVFYQGILDQIERNDYDVFTRRASLSGWEKLKRLPGLWLRLRCL